MPLLCYWVVYTWGTRMYIEESGLADHIGKRAQPLWYKQVVIMTSECGGWACTLTCPACTSAYEIHCAAEQVELRNSYFNEDATTGQEPDMYDHNKKICYKWKFKERDETSPVYKNQLMFTNRLFYVMSHLLVISAAPDKSFVTLSHSRKWNVGQIILKTANSTTVHLCPVNLV